MNIPPWPLPDGTVIDYKTPRSFKRPDEVWTTGRQRATFGTTYVEMSIAQAKRRRLVVW